MKPDKVKKFKNLLSQRCADNVLTMKRSANQRMRCNLGFVCKLAQWHGTNSTLGLLPGQRLVPLDELVRERILVRQQVGFA